MYSACWWDIVRLVTCMKWLVSVSCQALEHWADCFVITQVELLKARMTTTKTEFLLAELNILSEGDSLRGVTVLPMEIILSWKYKRFIGLPRSSFFLRIATILEGIQTLKAHFLLTRLTSLWKKYVIYSLSKFLIIENTPAGIRGETFLHSCFPWKCIHFL